MLSLHPPFVPLPTTIVGKATGCCLAVTIVIGNTISERSGLGVCFRAMNRVGRFNLRVNVNDGRALRLHRIQHPDNIISVLFDGIGKIKATATALGTRHDE